MKLIQGIRLCGSGVLGLTPADDCHYYVLNGGSELTLIDYGLVGDPQAILLQVEKDGLSIRKLKYLFLAHAHPDYANGNVWFRRHLGVQVMASALEARVMEQGLLETLSAYPEPGLYEQLDSMGCNRVDRIIEDNEEIRMRGLRIRAFLTPGCMVDSTSYEVEIDGRRHVFMGDEVFYQGSVSVLTVPFSDYEYYYRELKRLKGHGVDGLLPSHPMWTLQDGQKHIDEVLWDFEVSQRPNLKPSSQT